MRRHLFLSATRITTVYAEEKRVTLKTFRSVRKLLCVLSAHAVVEPLTVVIHTELHLRPDMEKYVKPRVELECISNNVTVSIRTCQVAYIFTPRAPRS